MRKVLKFLPSGPHSLREVERFREINSLVTSLFSKNATFTNFSSKNVEEDLVNSTLTNRFLWQFSVTLVLLFRLRPRRSIWRLGTSGNEKRAQRAFRSR